MTLPIPFIVYGTIYKTNGVSPLNNASVSIVDLTVGQGTWETTTGVDGKYTANIRDYASVGDTIQVTGDSTSETFILDLAPPSEQINITTSEIGLSLIGSDSSATFNVGYPDNIDYPESRNVKVTDFWTGGRSVTDTGKDMETLTISGHDWDLTTVVLTTTYTDRFEAIKYFMSEILDAGKEITTSGFENTDLNTTWYSSKFGYSVYGGEDTIAWTITLEKS